MTAQIQQNSTLTFGGILYESNGTTELTGVTGSQVTMYVWDANTSTMTNVPNTGSGSFTWSEVSSSNMPGLYSITVPSSYIVGVGDFVVYFYTSSSTKAKYDFQITTVNPLLNIWDELRANHFTVGTTGEMARISFLSQKGHIKVDPVTNTYILYAEDGATPLFKCSTLGPNGQPAAVGATERLLGIP